LTMLETMPSKKTNEELITLYWKVARRYCLGPAKPERII
jgi:hypothetical protein